MFSSTFPPGNHKIITDKSRSNEDFDPALSTVTSLPACVGNSTELRRRHTTPFDTTVGIPPLSADGTDDPDDEFLQESIGKLLREFSALTLEEVSNHTKWAEHARILSLATASNSQVTEAQLVAALKHFRVLVLHEDHLEVTIDEILSTPTHDGEPLIRKVIRILHTSPSPTVKREATWTITNVAAGKPEQARAVVDSGAITVLLSMVKFLYDSLRESSQWDEPPPDEVEELIELALWALANISGDRFEYRAVIAENENALDLMMQLVFCRRGACVSTQRIGIWFFANLLRLKPCLPLQHVERILHMMLDKSGAANLTSYSRCAVSSVETASYLCEALARVLKSYNKDILSAHPHRINTLSQYCSLVMLQHFRQPQSPGMMEAADFDKATKCRLTPEQRLLPLLLDCSNFVLKGAMESNEPCEVVSCLRQTLLSTEVLSVYYNLLKNPPLVSDYGFRFYVGFSHTLVSTIETTTPTDRNHGIIISCVLALHELLGILRDRLGVSVSVTLWVPQASHMVKTLSGHLMGIAAGSMGVEDIVKYFDATLKWTATVCKTLREVSSTSYPGANFPCALYYELIAVSLVNLTGLVNSYLLPRVPDLGMWLPEKRRILLELFHDLLQVPVHIPEPVYSEAFESFRLLQQQQFV